MNKKGWKYMDKKEFQALRKLFDAGLTKTEVKRLTGRAIGTLGHVACSETLGEYKESLKRLSNKYPKKSKPQFKTEEVKTPTTSAEQMIALMAQVNSSLDVIGKMLVKWDAEKKFEKKGFFK